MTTLRILTERIRRMLSGGEPSDNDRVKDVEIRHAIVAGCAKQLALSSLTTNYNLDGGAIPADSLIATYTGIPVTRGDNGCCRAALPATPMNLPERVGVFAVYPSGRPREQFMYVPPGVVNIWEGIKMLNPLNAVMFTVESRWIDVYSDLIGAGIHSLDMKLCVVDINKLGDYDPLPISADMEMVIINEILEQYGLQPKTERKEGREASPAR